MVTEVGAAACAATDSVSVGSPTSAVSQRVAQSITSSTPRHQHGSGANLRLGHRAIKRRVNAKQGFREFQAARPTPTHQMLFVLAQWWLTASACPIRRIPCAPDHPLLTGDSAGLCKSFGAAWALDCNDRSRSMRLWRVVLTGGGCRVWKGGNGYGCVAGTGAITQ